MPADEQQRQDDAITRLARSGKDALHGLTELPGGTRALQAYNDLRTRTDEMNKKVRGIDKLEARIDKLEREVASLKRAQKAAAPKAPAKKPASP